MRLEVQVQPPFYPKPYPLNFKQSQPFVSPSSTPFPDPFNTKPPINPELAASVYQQHQINLNPSYNPLYDQNVLDPQVANAILNQQFLVPEYGFRQNFDGSVSTYTTPTSTQNRPPFFNWFGANNNNNNYQSDTPQQQGPIIGFLTNLAQNNPLTNFLSNFQQQQNDQTTTMNPFQTFFSNLNPLNFFSNNNRPQQASPIQSDYVASLTPQNQHFSGNIDSSVFSSDNLLHLNQGYPNPGLSNPLQSVNFNPGVNRPTPIYNPNFNPILGSFQQNPGSHNPYPNQYASTIRPNQFTSTIRPNQFTTLNSGQPFYPNPSPYAVYQNPYQMTYNPIYNNKRKTNKTGKKKNKNKVDIETESSWFNEFLDKRKEASLDVTSKRPSKSSSDEDDDAILDDYF